MSDTPAGGHPGPGQYEILPALRATRQPVDGLVRQASIAHGSDGATHPWPEADQAALYDLLRSARPGLPDLGHGDPPKAMRGIPSETDKERPLVAIFYLITFIRPHSPSTAGEEPSGSWLRGHAHGVLVGCFLR
jgi:hypothetical protein